jgi:hypothetical protein
VLVHCEMVDGHQHVARLATYSVLSGDLYDAIRGIAQIGDTDQFRPYLTDGALVECLDLSAAFHHPARRIQHDGVIREQIDHLGELPGIDVGNVTLCCPARLGLGSIGFARGA